MASLNFVAVYFIAHLLLGLVGGIWAYGDAKERNRSGILWFLITFCLFPVGPLLWLSSRPKLPRVTSSVDPDAALKKLANDGQL
jgi:hypothetical protein